MSIMAALIDMTAITIIGRGIVEALVGVRQYMYGLRKLVLLILLSVSAFIFFMASIASASRAVAKGAEFLPPAIQANIPELKATSDGTANINATITISENKQQNYILIDLAGSGGGYNPQTLEGYKSRIEAKGTRHILTLIQIHRLEDGTLQIMAGSHGEEWKEETLSGDGTISITLDYATVTISRSEETITIGYIGEVHHGDIKNNTKLHLVTWAYDWIDNEALLISDPPETRAHISAYIPPYDHKPFFISRYPLSSNTHTRIFTVGYRPYTCLDAVPIEFSSPHTAILTIGNNKTAYSSTGGIWGALIINATNWDNLCSLSPAKITINGKTTHIHFLKVPYYYTLDGIIATMIALSIHGELENATKKRDSHP